MGVEREALCRSVIRMQVSVCRAVKAGGYKRDLFSCVLAGVRASVLSVQLYGNKLCVCVCT